MLTDAMNFLSQIGGVDAITNVITIGLAATIIWFFLGRR